jgi:hypothetical protein
MEIVIQKGPGETGEMTTQSGLRSPQEVSTRLNLTQVEVDRDGQSDDLILDPGLDTQDKLQMGWYRTAHLTYRTQDADFYGDEADGELGGQATPKSFRDLDAELFGDDEAEDEDTPGAHQDGESGADHQDAALELAAQRDIDNDGFGEPVPFENSNNASDNEDERQDFSDEQVSKLLEQHQNMVNSALAKRSHVMPFPWETGILASWGKLPNKLEPKAEPWMALQEPPLPPQTEAASTMTSGILHGKRTSSTKDWLTGIAEDRQVAVKMWHDIVMELPDCSVLGKQIAQARPQDIGVILNDTLEGKSTSTLKTRAYSLMKLREWTAEKGLKFLPIQEEVLYSYMCDQRASKAPATRLTKLREALNFAKFTVGLQFSEDVTSSKRLAGVALSMMKRKRKLRQRDPFTAQDVIKMEKIVSTSGRSPSEIVFMGYVLFLIHTRSRFSDAMHVVDEPVVRDSYVEAISPSYKTMGAKSRRGRWLEMVGPANGVSGEPWAQKWLEARASLGLAAGNDWPLMPTQTTTGAWARARMTVGEGIHAIIRMCTLCGLTTPDSCGTHSCKVTALSWLAKAGCKMEHRKLLGGHISRNDESSITYSRDLMAAPLRALDKLYRLIRQNKFDPDRSRTGMWIEHESPAEDSENFEDGPDETTSSSESSSGASTNEEEASVRAERILEKRATATKSKVISTDTIWQHPVRRTFHLCREGSSTLVCGRDLDRFTRVHEPLSLVPRCSTCFRGVFDDD